jgi:hypothetical protein
MENDFFRKDFKEFFHTRIFYQLCRGIVTINKKISTVKYSLINAREHRNHFHSLNILIHHVIKKFDKNSYMACNS